MSQKIMIIDDDPEIVSYLTEFFKDNGYETVTATNAEEAMDVVQNEKPDLITLDIEMPGDWGPRFYRKLTQKGGELKNIPVIVISGLTGNKYAVPKAVASLNKPFDRDELLRIVRETIG
jgi:CheY-like chemotaxis protein